MSVPFARSLKRLTKRHVGPFIARHRPPRTDLPWSTWQLALTEDGRLGVAGHDLAAIARAHGTPVHVVRGEALDAAADAALQPHRDGTGADVFYSYKTNPVPGVLRRLHARGIGAEVISPFELWLAFELGVPGERIVYNGPAKSTASVRTAIEHGVFLVNANSASDAARICAVASELGRTVQLGLRVALPGMWGGQFGIAGASELANAARAALASPFVSLQALHVHRGLTIRDAATLDGYVGQVLASCDALRASTGWHPTILDLGGSLACPTVAPITSAARRLNQAFGADLVAPEPSATLSIADASSAATARVREHFVAAGLPAPAVLLEPGRSLTSGAQLLLTSVVDVKDDGALAHAVLDAGINVAEPVPNEFHQLFSVSAPTAPPAVPYRLVGPICTPADVLYANWRLPALEPGHVLAIMDSGAYFVPFSTSFSFPRPAVVIADGTGVTVERRGETFSDLVGLDAGWDRGGELPTGQAPGPP